MDHGNQLNNWVIGEAEGAIVLYFVVITTATFNAVQILEAGTEIKYVGWQDINAVYQLLEQCVKSFSAVRVHVNLNDTYPWQQPGYNALASNYQPSVEFLERIAPLPKLLNQEQSQ